MKKIKITKQIAGYEIGREIDTTHVMLPIEFLVDNGYAEELKFDLDAFRANLEKNVKEGNIVISPEDLTFFNAFKTVSEYIDHLNDTSEVTTNDKLTEIFYNKTDAMFGTWDDADNKNNLLPLCRNEDIAEEVIESCLPELNIIFKV